MELKEVFDSIKEHYVFDEREYPRLTGYSEAQKIQFILGHILFRYQKSLSSIAEICESADHGNHLRDDDMDEVDGIPLKFLIDTIALAQALKVSPETLELQLKRWAASKSNRIHP